MRARAKADRQGSRPGTATDVPAVLREGSIDGEPCSSPAKKQDGVGRTFPSQERGNAEDLDRLQMRRIEYRLSLAAASRPHKNCGASRLADHGIGNRDASMPQGKPRGDRTISGPRQASDPKQPACEWAMI